MWCQVLQFKTSKGLVNKSQWGNIPLLVACYMSGEQLGLKYLSTSYNSKKASIRMAKKRPSGEQSLISKEAKLSDPDPDKLLHWHKGASICAMHVKAFTLHVKAREMVPRLAQWNGQNLKTIYIFSLRWCIAVYVADLASTLLWKVTAARWPNEVSEPKAESVGSNLCLMLEMSKDNSDSNTNPANLTWFLLCNDKSVTVTHTEVSLIVPCHLFVAVKYKPVFFL